MAKVIQLPDGNEAEFPDEMSDDAIAQVLQRQFGTPEQQEPEGSATGRFLEAAGEQVNPLTIAQGLLSAAAHPIDTLSSAKEAMGQQWEQAGDEFMAPDGSIVKGVGHALAGSVPLIGPAAAQVGERIGTGDVAGGLGSAAGLTALALVPGALARAKVGSKVSGVAGRVIAPIKRGFQRAELEALQGGTATKALASGAREALTKGGLEARKAFLKEQLGVSKGRDAPRPKPPAPKPPESEVPKLKPAAKAKVEHRVARTAKESGAPLEAKAIKGMAEELQEIVMSNHRMGLSPNRIADAVRLRLKSKVEGLTDSASRKMTEQVLEANGVKVGPIRAQTMNDKIREAQARQQAKQARS